MTRGFSTIEIVLALMIISSAVAGAVLVILGIPGAIADGHLRAGGSQRADENLQHALQIGLHDFSAVISLATTSANGYDSALSVASLSDEFTEQLTSTASWIDTKGKRRTISRIALLTDYLSAARSGCAGLLAGNWMHPSMTTYALGPGSLFPDGNASHRYPISAIAISGTTLALSVRSTTIRTEPDIYLFDLTDPTHPLYRGSIDTNQLQYAGPSALAIQGTTLFAANTYGATFNSCGTDTQCSQMQAYDITNLRGPRLLYPYKLSTNIPPFATGSSGQATGNTLLVDHGLLYLGLKKTGNSQGEEFNIIDASHGTPVWLGGYAIGRTINQILVSHGYAYLATDSPHNELVVLDVHDPAHVTFVGNYDASGGTTFGYGESIALAGGELALGRSFSSPDPALYFLDVSHMPAAVQSSMLIGDSFHPQNVDAIVISKYLAFVLDDLNLSIWNIADPAHPTQYSSPMPLQGVTTGQQGMTGVALACRANALYVASVDTINSGRLTIITGS